MGYNLRTRDGEIGKIKEFYFDDDCWTIRYLVVETGNWLFGRQVLISPHALGDINKKEQYVVVNLTNKQIEDSPPLGSEKPVSRQYEEEYFGYYGLPMYWNAPNMGATYPYTSIPTVELSKNKQIKKNEEKSHLRSTHQVSGYNIRAKDGEIGHVDDFIIDDETWLLKYLVIDTKNWWPGKKILISPHWISSISWANSEVLVDLPLHTIKQAPEYTDEVLLTKAYETELQRYYKQQSLIANEAINRAL